MAAQGGGGAPASFGDEPADDERLRALLSYQPLSPGTGDPLPRRACPTTPDGNAGVLRPADPAVPRGHSARRVNGPGSRPAGTVTTYADRDTLS